MVGAWLYLFSRYIILFAFWLAALLLPCSQCSFMFNKLRLALSGCALLQTKLLESTFIVAFWLAALLLPCSQCSFMFNKLRLALSGCALLQTKLLESTFIVAFWLAALLLPCSRNAHLCLINFILSRVPSIKSKYLVMKEPSSA